MTDRAQVERWLAACVSQRDEPGTYDASYAPVAVDGDVPVTEAYDNCFVLRFDDEGRCSEFTEYFVKRPRERL